MQITWKKIILGATEGEGMATSAVKWTKWGRKEISKEGRQRLFKNELIETRFTGGEMGKAKTRLKRLVLESAWRWGLRVVLTLGLSGGEGKGSELPRA